MGLYVKDLNFKSFKNFNIVFESFNYYTLVGGINSGLDTLFDVLINNTDVNHTVNINNYDIKDIDYLNNIGIVNYLNNNSFLFETVKEELLYPLKNLNLNNNQITKRLKFVINKFNLNKIYNSNIKDLTNNQKQLLLFVIALLHEPKYLIINNAFNYLNDQNKELINNYLKHLVEKKLITIINLSNNLNEYMYTDYLYLINNFKIVLEGDPNKLMEDDKLFLESGVELPLIIDLSNKLKLYDLIDHNYSDIESMVNDLWK